MSDVADFLTKDNLFAVIGVSLDETKYGNKIYRDLRDAGYDVYAVHPEGGEVEGRTRFRDLGDLPQKPDVVVCVVPPRVTVSIVEQCAELGIDKVWMQPGAQSAEAIARCAGHGIECIHNQCVMVLRHGN